MTKAQRELAARLALEFDCKVIRLRHDYGVIFEEGEVTKIFVPSSKRILGCGPKDRRVIGDLICLFTADLKAPTGRAKKYDFETFFFYAPDANFRGLTLYSGLDEGPMDDLFEIGLRKLFGALPSSRADLSEKFGDDFFSLQPLDQFSRGVQYLRGRLDELGEPFTKRERPFPVTVEITIN